MFKTCIESRSTRKIPLTRNTLFCKPQRKKERAQEEKRNIAAGNPGDVDFIGMVRQWRREHANKARPHESGEPPRICICVRKRPISDKERSKNDHDSVTCLNPEVWIHGAKLRVDGITKYLDHNSFKFDQAFDENASTDQVYKHTAMPLIDFVCEGSGGRATVFAYGQTGSGKTYTMNGIQKLLCEDLFLLLSEEDMDDVCSHKNTVVMVSFFEMYGGFIQDLLNDRQRLKVLEDGKGEVVVNGLQEVQASSPEEFLEIVETGNSSRTTHTTEANDTSSRSHAICQITLRDRGNNKLRGKLSLGKIVLRRTLSRFLRPITHGLPLVDLAGSERGTDTKSHNSQRRAESSDINTSLLALKECIRALDNKDAKHVPYRGSKLTLILKDCFTSDKAMTTMIATVSPGASAADHSLNTLRYADRIKEKRLPSSKLSPVRKRRPVARAGNLTTSKKPLASTGQHVNRSVERVNPSFLEEDHSDSKPEKEKEHTTLPYDANDSDDELAQEIIEQEEEVLNMHMGFIAENAQLLSREGPLLESVQRANVSDEEIEQYVSELESILDQKEDMIVGLQEKLASLQLLSTLSSTMSS